MNTLIIGDSFADPTGAPPDSWHRCLPGKITNLARAGVGQYKILKQLESAKDYDNVIVLVTSEYRIHALQNPFYTDKDHRHHNSDLILSDIESRLPDLRSQHLCYWFKHIMDMDHAVYIHNLLLEKIEMTLTEKQVPFTPITFFPRMNDIHDFDGQLLDLSHIAKLYPGNVNHLSHTGHQRVVDALKELI